MADADGEGIPDTDEGIAESDADNDAGGEAIGSTNTGDDQELELVILRR